MPYSTGPFMEIVTQFGLFSAGCFVVFFSRNYRLHECLFLSSSPFRWIFCSLKFSKPIQIHKFNVYSSPSLIMFRQCLHIRSLKYFNYPLFKQSIDLFIRFSSYSFLLHSLLGRSCSRLWGGGI